MPQQLIYTSAPRGLVAGRSGHCTVARSASMREALMLQLEKFSYYQHLSLSGGKERPIFAYRIVDIRGVRFHVLTRIQDAGLDFTGRTNFIAHHLVFTPEEIRQFSTPPVILRDWPGWMKSWTKEPQLLECEDWSSLTALSGKTCVPARTWQSVTGDSLNGYGLLETRSGTSFRVDDQTDEAILGLFAECLELLEVRDPRRDFRATAWNYTFTTSMQEQDNPADFRWRCIHSDNPASNRFAMPDCRSLSAVRATKWTGEETAFARSGRQAPRIITEPQDVQIVEGSAARFTAKAEGVPAPTYQWFSVDRANNGQVLADETKPELLVSNPVLGTSRYLLSVTNSAGNIQSRVATLSVEQKLRLAQSRLDSASRGPAKAGASYIKSPEDIERQRKRLEAQNAEKAFHKKRGLIKIFFAILTVILLAVLAPFALKRFAAKKPPVITQQPSIQTNKDVVGIAPVRAIGTTPLVYQWYKNDKLILSATNSELSQADARAGSFFVVISSISGSTTSVTVTLPDTELTPPPQRTVMQDNMKELPVPWTYTNLGNRGAPKTPIADNGIFTIIGAGKNFSGGTDDFIFVSKPVSNSIEFTARLLKISRGKDKCQCGIMLRESKQPGSPFVFIGISSTNIIWTQRISNGANCESKIVAPDAKPPILLELGRNSNIFFGRVPSDKQKQFSVRTTEICIPETNYLVGFAVTSGSSLEVNAEFDMITNK